MKGSTPILPVTVVDQIRLWELERNRLRSFKGYLYQMFSRDEEYEQIKKYAADFGYLIWENDKKRMLFVSRDGHEHIKTFIKQQKA